MNQVITLGAPDGAPRATGLTPDRITEVRLVDGTLVDLTLTAGRITGITPAATGTAADGAPDSATAGVTLDATGWRALPATTEPHAHLDKALSAERVDYFSGTTQNDLPAAIEQWSGLLESIDEEDIRSRATRAVARYVAQGTTTVRTHVDFPRTGDPLRGLRALVAVREALAGVLTLQITGLTGFHTPGSVIDDAVELGLDVLGGCPHLSPDPHHETTRVLDVAERTGLPVDLHTDEQTGTEHLDVVDLAQQVIARGLTQRVTASHCVRLGSLPPDELRPVLDLVARAGIGIVTLPITNLYLQGWDATHLAPRGLTAVRAVLDAGIPLAAGADNLRDPFNPVGRADPFETTSLLVTAGHLTPVEALAAVTTGPRTVLGLPPVLDVGPTRPAAGLWAGGPPAELPVADLVLVPDVDLGDVLAGNVGSRVVLHGGRVLADTRTAQTLDLTAPFRSTAPHDPARTPGAPAPTAARPALEHVR